MGDTQTKNINILVISGSLRADSSTNAVVKTIATLAPENVNLTIYNGLEFLPHFNDSRDPPQQVVDLRDQIRAADGVLFCTPEYAFGVPGSLKNAIDWTVSSGEFVYKPVALVTAATGGDKAHASLLLTFTALSANIPEQSRLLISYIRSKLDEKGAIKDQSVTDAITAVIHSLIQTIKANN